MKKRKQKSILKCYNPLSSTIGYAKMPKEMVNDLNNACNEMIRGERESIDWSHNLAGKVKQEILIPPDVGQKWGAWLDAQIREYMKDKINNIFLPGHAPVSNVHFENGKKVSTILSDKKKALQYNSIGKILFSTAWFVRSFSGDYNPAHRHTDCDLSCVGYLKLPDWEDEISKDSQDNNPSNGQIEFSTGYGASKWSIHTIKVFPRVGDWYLFPSDLTHTVYPFRSDGERRSFSINIITQGGFNNKHNKEKIYTG